MIQQIQPNLWSCLPTAFAMVMDYPVSVIIQSLGHDGSKIIPLWEHLPSPRNRQGFHIQELIRLAVKAGWAVTPIEAEPTSEVDGKLMPLGLYVPNLSEMFVERWMLGTTGVVTGQAIASGMRHAVAWNMDGILDPSGVLKTIDEFAIEAFWKMELIKSD